LYSLRLRTERLRSKRSMSCRTWFGGVILVSLVVVALVLCAAERLFSPAARVRGDAFAKRMTTMRVEQLKSPPLAQSGAKLGWRGLCFCSTNLLPRNIPQGRLFDLVINPLPALTYIAQTKMLNISTSNAFRRCPVGIEWSSTPRQVQLAVIDVEQILWEPVLPYGEQEHPVTSLLYSSLRRCLASECRNHRHSLANFLVVLA